MAEERIVKLAGNLINYSVELQPGEKMLLLLFREPHPLYKILRQNGHDYETELSADGTFEILISR